MKCINIQCFFNNTMFNFNELMTSDEYLKREKDLLQQQEVLKREKLYKNNVNMLRGFGKPYVIMSSVLRMIQHQILESLQ